MTTHVLVNGLGLTHKGSIGFSIATMPDVCKTPTPGGPVPMPYPNMANHSSLENGTTTVFVKGNMIANKPSDYARSTGDEPGTVGGVKSNTNMKEATWITYSFDVMMQGENACRHTDKMFHNHQNTVSLAGNTDPAVPAPTFTPNIDCGEKLQSGEWEDECCKEEFCAMIQATNSLQQQGKLQLTRPSPSNYMKRAAAEALGWTAEQRTAFNVGANSYTNGLRSWSGKFTNLVAEKKPESPEVADKFVARCRYEKWKSGGAKTPIAQGERVAGGMSPDHVHDAGLGGPVSGPALEQGLKWVNSKVNGDVGRGLRNFDPAKDTGGITPHASCNCS